MIYDIKYDSEKEKYIYRDCTYLIYHSIGYSEYGAYAYTKYNVHFSDGSYKECNSQKEVFDVIDAFHKKLGVDFPLAKGSTVNKLDGRGLVDLIDYPKGKKVTLDDMLDSLSESLEG